MVRLTRSNPVLTISQSLHIFDDVLFKHSDPIYSVEKTIP